MSRVKTILLLSLCLICAISAGASAVAAPQRRAGKKITVRAKGHRAVVVNAGGRSHRLNLSEHINAARIEGVSVAFLTRKDDLTYLVLDVCGTTKWPQDARHCGLGTECSLVWLKLDSRWRVLEAKSASYVSCWYTTSNDDAPRVEGRRLSVEYDNFHDETRGQVTYDADSPEKGLVVVNKPLSEAKPSASPTQKDEIR